MLLGFVIGTAFGMVLTIAFVLWLGSLCDDSESAAPLPQGRTDDPRRHVVRDVRGALSHTQ